MTKPDTQDSTDKPESSPATPPATMPNAPSVETIELDEPVMRGEQEIRTIQLRKPRAGELRGISLQALAEMDVSALQRLLPRITLPSLTANEVAALDLADITAMGVKVSTFLLKKADRESLAK